MNKKILILSLIIFMTATKTSHAFLDALRDFLFYKSNSSKLTGEKKESAIKNLKKKQIDTPLNPIINNNLGLGQYQNRQYESAYNNFERAHAQSNDLPNLQAQAALNAGTTAHAYAEKLYEDKKLDEALQKIDLALSWYTKLLENENNQDIITAKIEHAQTLKRQIEEKHDNEDEKNEQENQQKQDDKNQKNNQDQQSQEQQEENNQESRDNQKNKQDKSNNNKENKDQDEKNNDASKQQDENINKNKEEKEEEEKESQDEQQSEKSTEKEKEENSKNSQDDDEEQKPEEEGFNQDLSHPEKNSDENQDKQPSIDYQSKKSETEENPENQKIIKKETLQQKRIRALIESLDQQEGELQKEYMKRKTSIIAQPTAQGQRTW